MGLQPVFDNIKCKAPCFKLVTDILRGHEDSVIVCLETAADFIPISNMSFVPHLKVYASAPVDIPDVTVYVVPDCFTSKIYGRLWGLYVTSEEQTLADMLNNWPDSDSTVMMPALANYYFDDNRKNFDAVIPLLNEAGRRNFEELREGAVTYYAWQ